MEIAPDDRMGVDDVGRARGLDERDDPRIGIACSERG